MQMDGLMHFERITCLGLVAPRVPRSLSSLRLRHSIFLPSPLQQTHTRPPKMAPPPPLEPPPPYTPLLIPLLSPSTSSSVLPTLGTLVQLQVTLEALRSHALTKRKAVVEQRGAVAGLLEGEKEAERVRSKKKEERERKEKDKKDAERKGSSTPGPKGVKVERGSSLVALLLLKGLSE